MDFNPKRIVFGVPAVIKPVCNAPSGRQRLRLRSKSAAHLFVATPQGIRDFIVCDAGNTWYVDYALEQGRNFRPVCEVVHLFDKAMDKSACCGKSMFELPIDHRVTTDAKLVTCKGNT